MKVDGRVLIIAVPSFWRLAVDPEKAAICHCTGTGNVTTPAALEIAQLLNQGAEPLQQGQL
jgi:hypothetical protein